MREGLAVASSLGIELDFNSAEELRRVAGMFTQPPSMLQDVRAGPPLEWEPIVNAVVEMVAVTGVAVPTLKNIAACVAVLDARIRSEALGSRRWRRETQGREAAEWSSAAMARLSGARLFPTCMAPNWRKKEPAEAGST